MKAALYNLFNNNCAYCESRISGNQTGDVEHFRPKGSIKNPDEDPLRPGYYWLAADWNNLFLSCQSCNTARKEPELDEQGNWVIASEATGKKDQFPLSDPTRHLRNHNENLADEEPLRLLIDPCQDQPEDFFSYKDDGSILPKADDETSHAYRMAAASIRVFDLKRPGLVQRRREHYLDMLNAWKDVDDVGRFVEGYEDAEPAVQSFLQSMKSTMQDNIDRNATTLIACIDDDQVFAGFCRYVLSDFVGEAKAIKARFEEIFGD